MIQRSYDAILVDVDGTLVDDHGQIVPGTGEALRAAAESGVRVMIATGRYEMGTVEIVEQLGLNGPAVVYNGAAVWCPTTGRLLEERVLSNLTRERVMDYARERDATLITVTHDENILQRFDRVINFAELNRVRAA